MTYEQIGAGVLAAVVVAWPKLSAAGKAVLRMVPGLAPQGTAVTYEQAIHDLALVRARLAATGHLGDEKSPQRAAIDTLTLALVAGSDK